MATKSKKNQIIWEKLDWTLFKPNPVIGVDEVGRGCLAGPVYAGACILKPVAQLSKFEKEILSELTDSKLLTEVERMQLSIEILKTHAVAIGQASEDEISEINILKASLLAMKRAVEDLLRRFDVSEAHVVVDGKFKIPGLSPVIQQTPVIKGDLRLAPISAASICAKVARDQWMKDKAEQYPKYGFADHKGYGTPAHKQAIALHGPCPIHRRTFAGVKEYLLV